MKGNGSLNPMHCKNAFPSMQHRGGTRVKGRKTEEGKDGGKKGVTRRRSRKRGKRKKLSILSHISASNLNSCAVGKKKDGMTEKEVK